MSDEPATDFIVFYAWQDDLPKSTNQNLIRHALREASSVIEGEFATKDLHIILDEATRKKSGSPNIPAAILAKIDACDAFVCDVTTINRPNTPALPNPNVVFELGYAVSRIGWGRIIMLFNKEFGNFPGDMPFDFDRHRASPYSFAAPNRNTTRKELTASRQPLMRMLSEALRAVLTENPQKPFHVQQMTEDQIKRTKDMANLRWLMSKVNIPTLDNHIAELPHKIYDSVFPFWEDFNAVVGSSLFSLYDKEAQHLVNEMREAWRKTLSYPDFYHSPPERDVLFFNSSLDIFTEKQKKAWNAIEKHRKRLSEAFKGLLSHIRKEYIEIDLEKLSDDAWSAYGKFRKEMAERLKEPKIKRRKTKQNGLSN
jgi:hypothetical protein